jgi:uncharacterized membrane protein YkvI
MSYSTMDAPMLNSYLFRVFLIPSAVFLSVLFGGSYGTGREVMEFVSQHGPLGGVVSLLAVVLTYMVMLFISFELARKFRQFEYRGFFRLLLGRFWFLYEIVVLVGMLITLAICATAAGAVLESRFGLSHWLGSSALLAMVFTLNYQGRAIVEKTMILAVVALMAVLAVLAFKLLGEPAKLIQKNFQDDTMHWAGALGGAQYALVNAGFIPLLLYCARGLESRSQAAMAGITAACVTVIPGTIFHLAFMSAYPAITEQELPVYWLMEQLTSPLFLDCYVVVLFVLIAQTGVGMLQGFIERVDAWHSERFGKPLSHMGHGLVALGMSGGSIVLSSVGIIALIAAGYSVLAAAFILVFALPMLTRGIWLVLSTR